jgi:hypothetical protein
VLRTFRGTGSVVWGARTLPGSDTLADDYKYVPVRRLALYLEETLYRSTQWVVFEPNDAPLWAQAAGQLISATNGTVDLTAGVAVDVRRVVEHGRVMLMGAAGDSLDHANAALDSDGVGELLPDWDDEWLEADRERLRQIRLHLLEASALGLAEVGRYGLPWKRRWPPFAWTTPARARTAR